MSDRMLARSAAIPGVTPWKGRSVELVGVLNPQRWAAQALCGQVDPEIFFPDPGGSATEAKLICSRCPVRDACLEYAMEAREPHGVFGGFTEHDRRLLRRATKRGGVVEEETASHRLRMKLHHDGHTDTEIARRAGLTRSGVRHWRAVNGLPSNRAGQSSVAS